MYQTHGLLRACYYKFGGQSIEVRVKDVNSDGCVIFLEELDDQNHNPLLIVLISDTILFSIFYLICIKYIINVK